MDEAYARANMGDESTGGHAPYTRPRALPQSRQRSLDALLLRRILASIASALE